MAVAGAAAMLLPAPAGAQPLSLRDSFRIGSGAGVLCTAQSLLADPALASMFDRAYAIVCRDAAVPVGHIYALRTGGDDPVARLAALRADRIACEAAAPGSLPGLGQVESSACRLLAADVDYSVHIHRAGGIVFVAEGLTGYDSALQLGLRNIAEDREVEGEIAIATTGAGDPAAFARAQAGTLDPQRALAEAYRRNNAGNYAEAAEFFGELSARDESPAARAEALANEALQKSNLGRFAEARPLFARAADMAGTEPVTARRLRNYQAMHLLNQGLANEALAELERPMPSPAAREQLGNLVIDPVIAAQLSAESPGARQLGGVAGLTDQDKVQILDAQMFQLRGTAMRLLGRDVEAEESLRRAVGDLVAIREGRIAATMWMRAQILDELAAIAEARGDAATAQSLYRQAVAVLQVDYPGTPAMLGAQGKLAAYLARAGRREEAEAIFRDIVATVEENGQSSPILRRLLVPYFDLLVARGESPDAVADLFAASQVLVRPGVAQTQAILARQLSGGSDEAARLFRQSVDLTRDIERTRTELARIEAAAGAPAQAERAPPLRARIEQLQQDQLATQSRLAQFSRYRVAASNAIAIGDLQSLLGEGEAYFKMLVVENDAYGIFIAPGRARTFRLGFSSTELEREVDALRSTISVVENDQQLTYPFDLALAHRLYRQLFGPVEAELADVRHLVFEPDGAMLRLPPNLLVMDAQGVAAYEERVARPGADEFDFRGVEWLGRRRDISTAVSASAFRDVRRAPASNARADYLGFGENAPVTEVISSGGGTRAMPGSGACTWPLLAWSRPISASELFTARQAIDTASDGAGEVVTGEAFTDTSILQRPDLDEYRILHFATHGLVSGPRPECPAQPALLTSFGAEGSDGLLSFSEIFDLRLDADLVILSACDTAGHGGRAAAEAAGLSTGGDFALDGLVRAFVGAGGRIVVASHWPVPDDFNATQRLISGLFQAPPGTGVAAALRTAQLALMDQADTSHPYYWSGFAVVGDGTTPVIPPRSIALAGGN